MTTRLFPLFRSLRRAIGGGATTTGRSEAGSIWHRYFEDEDEEGVDQAEEDGAETRPSDAHYEVESEGGVVRWINPETWPVNSEEARRWRREFVAEGYRRQYAETTTYRAGGAHWSGVGRNVGGSSSDGNVFERGHATRRDDAPAFGGGLGTDSSSSGERRFRREPDLAIPVNGGEDWIHLAQ